MSAPDTLLLMTTSYPRATGGREAAGSFVADLAQALAERIDVRVVAPGDVSKFERISPRLAIYRYAAPHTRLSHLRVWRPRDALRIFSTMRAGASAAERAACDGHVRHTFALWVLPCGWWARTLWRRRGIPYSVWMLGSDVWSLGRIPLIRNVLRTVMRDAQHRFADGLQLATDSSRICGRQVSFLPSTRRLQTLNPDPPAEKPPYRFLFLGRWHPNKGVDLLLEALALLGEADWQRIAEVRINGGGPLSNIIQERARPLLRAGRPIVIGGYLPKDEAEAAILRADWLLIPSRIESIPVVFSDAMKLRRPVIATPVGDLPRLFGQANCGVLADDISASSLCRAIQGALATSPRTFEVAVRTQAAKFDLTTIAAQILQGVFENVR